jgi:7-keto-8-aminopelargonate synthetase-like enzyme
VPEGTSRLRVTTNAALSEADVDRAAAALAAVLA